MTNVNIGSVVTICENVGISFAVQNNQLTVRGDKTKVSGYLALIKDYKEGIKNYLNIIFEERVAIIEHEASIPKEWAEAFARINHMHKPSNIPEKTWQNIINNTGIMLDNHISEIINNSWSIADIFGVHNNIPTRAYDCMGLLILLGENKIKNVGRDRISVITRTGAEQGFYRSKVKNRSAQVLIWQLNQ